MLSRNLHKAENTTKSVLHTMRCKHNKLIADSVILEVHIVLALKVGVRNRHTAHSDNGSIIAATGAVFDIVKLYKERKRESEFIHVGKRKAEAPPSTVFYRSVIKVCNKSLSFSNVYSAIEAFNVATVPECALFVLK